MIFLFLAVRNLSYANQTGPNYFLHQYPFHTAHLLHPLAFTHQGWTDLTNRYNNLPKDSRNNHQMRSKINFTLLTSIHIFISSITNKSGILLHHLMDLITSAPMDRKMARKQQQTKPIT